MSYINNFLSFSLFPTSINIENIIYIITSLIDIIAITVNGVTLIHTIYYLLKYNLKSLYILSSQSSDTNLKIVTRNFISGLILALEFETANGILKMGLFLTVTVNKSTSSSIAAAITSENFLNNFLIFIMILAVRIAINPSLQRFGRNNK